MVKLRNNHTSNTNNQVTKVRRDKVLSCLTCPLCHQIFNEASTISECLCTFCKKCIYDKIMDEGLDSCPVCRGRWGCHPEKKLKPDNDKRNIIEKLFAVSEEKSKRNSATKIEECNDSKDVHVTPSPIPSKKNEKVLSPLVVDLPKMLNQGVMTKRRSRGKTKKAIVIHTPISSLDEHKLVESSSKKSMLYEQPIRTVNYKEQKEKGDATKRNYEEVNIGTHDRLKLPEFLEEDSSKSKYTTNGSTIPNHPVLEETSISISATQKDELSYTAKDKGKNIAEATSAHDNEDKFSIIYQRKTTKNDLRKSNIVPDAVRDVITKRPEGIVTPIWFSLVASQDQRTGVPLPQILPCYLRMKDVDVPVSIIRKYIAKKLNLTNESEVEIMLLDLPVIPSLRLRNLVDVWRQSRPTQEEIRTFVGSSAKDFVMVLSYARKVASP